MRLALSLTALLALSACDLFGGGGIEANDDTASTTAGQPVTIDVLANDDGEDIYVYRYDEVTENEGEVERNGARLVYTPAAGFTGTDRFSYQISDESPHEVEIPRTSAAEVTVTVE